MGTEDDVTISPPTQEIASGGGGGSRFRHTSFLKWRQNNKSDVSGMNVDGEFKKWPHPPEALHKGKVTYVVKFLGFVNVEEPKGIEVVRSAIQKMKFSKSVKKAEGVKTIKKELVISVDSITIQDSKYKIVDHCYPLHRISFCADDKSDKRMFAFIAKDGEDHICYVFDSEKCAEEITLTVGQAFEIAYQSFVDVQGKPSSSLKEEVVKLKNQVDAYEKENAELKARVKELEAKLGLGSELEDVGAANGGAANGGAKSEGPTNDAHVQNGVVEMNLIDTGDVLPMSPAPHQQDPVVGRRLENLLFDEEPFNSPTPSIGSPASHFDAPVSIATPAAPSSTPASPPTFTASAQPRETSTTSSSTAMPSLAPPPRPNRRNPAASASNGSTTTTASTNASTTASADASRDLFGATPFAPPASSTTTASSGVNVMNSGAPAVNNVDPFGNHDDLFGMSPFQNELQAPLQNPVDITFGSGNFDFGSSFQDFNQNSGPSVGNQVNAATSSPNPFL